MSFFNLFPGSWTPLHADVFRSYSWSANVCGKKHWLFLSPSQSHLVFDRHECYILHWKQLERSIISLRNFNFVHTALLTTKILVAKRTLTDSFAFKGIRCVGRRCKANGLFLCFSDLRRQIHFRWSMLMHDLLWLQPENRFNQFEKRLSRNCLGYFVIISELFYVVLGPILVL